MVMKPNILRNSAKAIIIRDERLLVVGIRDHDGEWFILPGGGQNWGETLHDALVRECHEEIGTEVSIGPLRLIREYRGNRHEFAATDGHAHQIEFMFACEVPADYQPTNGHTPDNAQCGVYWLPLVELDRHRLYPSVLRHLLRHGLPTGDAPVYLGDVN